MAKETHILLVAHGSRQKGWVAALEDWAASVASALPHVPVELNFLEITQPIFAERLLEVEGDVIVYPFFLSKSGHAGDEIPDLIRSFAAGRARMIEAPMLSLLAENARRRLEKWGAQPMDQVIVSGYGSSGHDDLWQNQVEQLQDGAGPFADGPKWRWAPAGHFLPDAKAPLRDHLKALQDAGIRRVVILPYYLGVSSYQEELIPSVIDEFPDLEIVFVPSSILPDEQLAKAASDCIAAELNGKEVP